MADEFDQYKVSNASAGDEFAQYKQTAPGTITGNVATIGPASSSYQPKVAPKGEGEGFIDRMTSRFGQNLEGAGQAILHPLDTISAMMSAKGNDVGPLDALPKQYVKDPANFAGDVMTAVMGKTVMGSPPGINMANAGKSLAVPVVRPAPLWQTAGTEATSPGFSWQTSTPEEIQAQLQKMASRQAPTARPPRPAPAWQANPQPATEIPIQGSTSEQIQAQLQKIASRKAPASRPARPAPAWQTNPQPTTDIAIQGSTPEEIQAHLSRMGARAKTMRPEGAPVEAAVPENATQKIPLPSEIQPGKATLVDPYRNQSLPQMRPAVSTTVEAHGYDPVRQEGFFHFKNGNIYRLTGVPQEMYDQFQNAESQGSFYRQNLKGRYQTDLVGKAKATKPSPGQQAKSALSR